MPRPAWSNPAGPMAEYKVKFEVFEGPLDLLLYLIRKEEVDIYEVNLTRLATQFIEYIETMRMLDLEIAGEFLVMAATLMYIKSRELLPVDQQAQIEGEEEGEDPRWELIRQLVEYKKFKDAAAQLQTLEARQENVFPRTPVKPEFETEAPARPEAFRAISLAYVRSRRRREGRQVCPLPRRARPQGSPRSLNLQAASQTDCPASGWQGDAPCPGFRSPAHHREAERSGRHRSWPT